MAAEQPEVEGAADVLVALGPGASRPVPGVGHPQHLIGHEDDRDDDRLRGQRASEHEERDQVADGDLLEHAHEADLHTVGADVIEQDADQDQHGRPAQGMARLAAPRVATGGARGEGEWHRDADHEHESRLDQVPVDRALPVDVLVVAGQPAPDRMPCERVEDAAAEQRQHDQAAVGVERHQAHRGRSRRRRR